jgi:hypothetical protein
MHWTPLYLGRTNSRHAESVQHRAPRAPRMFVGLISVYVAVGTLLIQDAHHGNGAEG